MNLHFAKQKLIWLSFCNFPQFLKVNKKVWKVSRARKMSWLKKFSSKCFAYFLKSKQTLQFDGKSIKIDKSLQNLVKMLCLLPKIKTNITIWRKNLEFCLKNCDWVHFFSRSWLTHARSDKGWNSSRGHLVTSKRPLEELRLGLSLNSLKHKIPKCLTS